MAQSDSTRTPSQLHVITHATSYLLTVLTLLRLALYEGRSINKLQNGAIPLILKIGKMRNRRFVGNLILNIRKKIFDDDVIIVTSSVHRTQSIGELFSPPVFCHNITHNS